MPHQRFCHRGPLDTRGGNADLFFASTVTPNAEVRLAKLNGDGHPFAAGARDLSLNCEPTFAPVPSGGYFWVVFTSRRTYGNQNTGAKEVVKELWVAAIDLNPAIGVDPSHPPFLLPGRTSVPSTCAASGRSTLQGRGRRVRLGDRMLRRLLRRQHHRRRPGLQKRRYTCAADGDHCDHTTDCCDASSGSAFINHVCAEPGPK